jgi:L-threonylcarbamoyladenylate synthase
MTDLNKAIQIIKQGGIGIFPTDTAFGIGCRVDRQESIERLFEIRKRPKEKAMPVLFDSIKRVKEYLLPFGSAQGKSFGSAQDKPFDEEVEDLMSKYWPGALTIVSFCKIEKVPSLVRGGGEKLGVRIPNHEITLALIEGAGVPVIGSSANFSGAKTPFSLEGLDKRLIKLVDFVLEGKTKGRRCASTVIDVTTNPWKIIRQGEVLSDL